MKGERELHNFYGEKTRQNCSNNNHYHNQKMQNGVSASSSRSSTSGFVFPDVGSSSIPPFDHNSQFPSPKSHFVDQFSSLSHSRYGRVLPDELGLAREFGMMNIGGFERDTEGFRVTDYNVPKIRPSNGQNYGSFEGSVNGFSGNGGFLTSLYRDERNVGDSLESIGVQNQSSVPYYGNMNCSIDFPFEDTNPSQRDGSYRKFLPILGGNHCYNDGVPMNRTNSYLGSGVPIMRVTDHSGNGGLIQRGDGGAYSHLFPLQVQSMYGPQIAGDPLHQCIMEGCKDPWACSQNTMYRAYSDEGMLPQCGMHMDSSQLVQYKQALSRGNKLYNSMREKMKAAEEREIAQSVALMKKGQKFETYGSENAFILKEKCCQLQSERCGNCSTDPMILQSMYTSMAEVQGNVYVMAKDQHGCRLLQKKFDKGSFEDVQLIFNEIIDHVVELTMNPFGNYLIQKLLDVCNEEQRMRILYAVTKDRGELVRICFDTHGTRVVQKLIEILKTKKQTSVVVRALEPCFLDLIKDLNGNHVVQRCLQCLSSEDNKFIFDGAAKFCVEIATHRHGCCVLQRCIAHSSGEHQKKLIEEICANGLHLAQDPFGNYVVQYIIELKIRAASAQLTSQFEGHYIHLATQKFGSHVVEKCLKYIEASRPRIVYEFLSAPHFEQLLQDPFANYVIQSALEVTKGPINDLLVAAVRPHTMLRTNPYCKKIFSRGTLKHK